ncbi:hypothetical protein PENFLA_c040G05611 [Penicillium flavigenum]|uniref:Uncharacterized protein n=1 Tax=Penicillium flavigenum TaxID=254877 RepID=A0A1V6SK50_9EURO|nr:hypothetical protein PENFLA_c040G05611 [Penicillium flavigenum]
MRDASHIPFDASKYAFRTNFDGLTTSDAAMKARLDDLAKLYQKALARYESEDKKARKEHSEEREEGMTENEFKDWVLQNYPALSQSRAELSQLGSQLSNAAAHAFGSAYTEKLQKEQAELNQAGWMEGYQPDFF